MLAVRPVSRLFRVLLAALVVALALQGALAQEGLQGVVKVEKGWRFLTEINTVHYDPDKITIENMEEALRQAGTYKKTFGD